MTVSQTLYRQFTPDLEVRGGDGRTVRGIAVPFDHPQRIDEHLTESFCRGAFAHQLGAIYRVPFYWGHSRDHGIQVGRQVAGREDAAGLYGEWRVSRTRAGDDLLELIKDEALRQLSIGFVPATNRVVNGVVQRVKAHLTEVAVVPQGAYGDAAAVADVRSVAGLSCPTCGQPVSAAVAPRLERARVLLAELPEVLIG